LKNHRHFSSDVTGRLTSLPFAVGVVACFVGGSFSDVVIRRWGKRWGRRIVGAAGMSLAGLAILAVPWVDNVVALGFLLALAFCGNDLAMGPAWAAAADIGERYTGTLAGAMNMISSFMAAIQAIAIGRFLDSDDLVMPFVLLAISYALGTLAWIGVDVRQTLANPD
jgi:ACS family glucarate transporter-like MFS transporter